MEKKEKQSKRTPAPVCPECGAAMRIRKTHKHKTREGKPRAFWGCTRYPHCTGTHGAHPDGTPLGTPGDRETKAARIAAHRALERAFGDQKSTKARTQAYRWLVRQKGLPNHIGQMTKKEAERVIHILTEKSTDGTLRH